jgi:methionyl-tRNA synthetase
MDIFTWSVPFLVEKVIGMIYQIVQKTAPSEEDEEQKGEAINLINEQSEAQKKLMKKSAFKTKLASFTKV